MRSLGRCQAEVERIVVEAYHREARAAGWKGHLGSRRMHDRTITRCLNQARGHRSAFPVRGSYEDARLQPVTIAVCGVHLRANVVTKAADA